MQLPDFLYFDPDGEVRFKGHRLRLIDVAARYDEGHSPEGISLHIYPTLELQLVCKAIAFYLENESQVREMIDTNAREIERQMARPRTTPSYEELRRRMAAKRAGQADQWDRQIAVDAAEGTLGPLLQRVDADIDADRLRESP